MTNYNQFFLLTGTPRDYLAAWRDWRPRQGCALPEAKQWSVRRLNLRPGLSGFFRCLSCLHQCWSVPPARTAHLGRPGAGILGRSLSGVGGKGCILASDLRAPHSLLRERKRSGDAGKLRQEEQGTGPV